MYLSLGLNFGLCMSCSVRLRSSFCFGLRLGSSCLCSYVCCMLEAV